MQAFARNRMIDHLALITEVESPDAFPMFDDR
jgi:hypothetical protein